MFNVVYFEPKENPSYETYWNRSSLGLQVKISSVVEYHLTLIV